MSVIPKIKLIGIGGAGVNALSRMTKCGNDYIELIAVNTDAQSLRFSRVPHKLLIGENTTLGLGAGMDIRLGEKAAKESKEKIKEVLKGAEMVFLTAGFGGGCLRGSSLILTNPEGPVRIDSIKPGSTVYTFSNGNLVKKKVLAAMQTGIKKVLELKTNNRTIYASEDHPFLRVKPLNSLSDNRFSKFEPEWIELRNLKVGDLVVILRKLPDDGKSLKLPNGSFTNEKFCQLFGFLLGDGWITKGKYRNDNWRIYFSPSNDEKNNQKYLSLIKEVFGLEMKRRENWYNVGSKEVGILLEQLGLHKKATEKEVPEWVFTLPKSQKKAFIIGLADADGCYSTQKGRSGLPKKEIKFEMSSEKLIRGLKILCDSMGLRVSNVTSRKRILKAPNSKEEKLSTSWILRIYKTHELTGVLPHPKARSGVGFLYKFRNCSRNGRLPEFFKYFGFNRIKSIREIGNEEVYDKTVEDSHNFVADGFVVHNTGSSCLPIIGEMAKNLGILTVAVITKPFSFEGVQRQRIANWGLRNLEGKVDSLICISNDKLLKIIGKNTSVEDAFWECDRILREAIQGISDLIFFPGIINVDLADIRGILKNSGEALFSQAKSKGENRAITAANEAIHSPLIDFPINKAKGILLNIAGGEDLSLFEIQEAAGFIKKTVSSRAKISFGASEDKTLKKGEIKITLIATGIK